jgi:hypothetical protein
VTDDPRYEADHRMGTFLRRSRRLELAQSLFFDFLDLPAHDMKPRHVATKVLTRILRQKRSLGGAQFTGVFFVLT